MACRQTKLDPVQGLIDYTLEVKPYHTKIIEVLVEYIHTDRIDVKVVDELDWCINVGIPDLGAQFASPIIAVNRSLKTFTVDGDLRKKIAIGQRLQVAQSTGNDGQYNVTNVLYNATTEETTIAVRDVIVLDIVDGIITDTLIEYCPGGNLFSSHVVSSNPPISLTGGWGVQWGPTNQYQVSTVNVIDNELTIPGNYLFEFESARKVILDYYDEDITAYTTDAEFDTIEDHHFVITYEITDVVYDGVNTIVSVLTALPLNFFYGFAEALPIFDIIDSDNVSNSFTIDGVHPALFPNNIPFNVRFTSVGNDGRYTPINVVTTATTTQIFVAENISNPYNMTSPIDGSIFITGYGWDEVGTFATVSEGYVAVTFNENLTFTNIGISLEDTMRLFNMENTAGEGFGGLSYGTIDSPTEPPIPETAIAPPTPNDFDMWYDTTTQRLYRWVAYQWEPIQTVFWLDTLNKQLYRRTKTRFADTGWFPVSAYDSDATTKAYDEGGFSTQPYTIYHGEGNVAVDVINNAYNIRGGNFAHYFHGGTHFSGYDSEGLRGVWKEKTFRVTAINGQGAIGTHTISILGNQLGSYTVGRHFFMSHSPTNEGWYSIIGADLDIEGNTQLTVAEQVHDASLFGQVDPRGLGVVHGAIYDPSGVDSVQGIYAFTHDQTFENDVWTVTHGLDDGIIVRTFLTTGEEILPASIEETFFGQLEITFDTPVAGTARLIGEIGGLGFQFSIQDVEHTATDMFINGVQYHNFVVPGNAKDQLPTGFSFQVTKTTSNDGTYTIKRTIYDSDTNTTRIGVFENIPSLVAEGIISINEHITPATVVVADASEEFETLAEIPDSQSWTHEQVDPLSTWTVEHGFEPGVIVRVYIGGEEVQPFDITEPEEGVAIISFTSPFSGIARVIGKKIPDFNSSSLVNAGVAMITYNWIGPLQMNVKLLPETLVSPTINSVLDVTNEMIRYNSQDTINTVTEAAITDELEFGWSAGDWYSYLILEAETTNDTFRVSGDQRTNLNIGQDIDVVSTPGYDDVYKIQSSIYNGVDTIVQVTPEIPVDGSGGFMVPIEDTGAVLNLFDTIGVTTIETADAAVLTTGGNLLSSSFDYPYWDLSGFDEDFGTVIHLYSSP